MDDEKLGDFIEVLKKQFPGYQYEISKETGDAIIVVRPVPEDEFEELMGFVESKILLPIARKNGELPCIVTLPAEYGLREEVEDDFEEELYGDGDDFDIRTVNERNIGDAMT